MTDRLTPPWDEIDDGIRPMVRVLWDAGLQTFASCEGGEGHLTCRPFVNIAANPDELDDIARRATEALIAAGFNGFHVARITNHQRSAEPWSEWPSYVCIEIWLI